MFKFMKKLSPVLSPLMASLFFISSTFSFVEAATNTASYMQNINYQKTLYSNKIASQKELNLFDDNTNSRYTPLHGVLLEKYFTDKVSLASISIYGDSDYALGVEYKVNGLWQKIDNWDNKLLSSLNNSWNKFPLVKSIETDAIRIRINPLVTNPNGIAELKFESGNGKKITKFSKNILIEDSGIFGELDRVYSAKESVVRLSSDVNMSKEGSFSMDISYSPNQISKAILSYDVMGITGGATVIRAINDELAQGGLLVQSDISNKSVSVKEEINPKWLKVGKNIVHFMAHQVGDLHLGYSVKNIKLSLVIDANKAKESKLVVSQPQKGIYYNDYAYIRGFVKSDSKITELRVDGKKINHTLGAFETLIKADSSDDIEVLASLESGERLKKILSINTNFSLHNPKIDKTELSTNAIKIFKNRDTQSRGALFVAKTNIDTDVVLDEAKLSIPKNALKSQREIKVLSLNQQDLPKLTQGMVNVTKGDVRGYRFLPHGIKFDKDSDLKLAFDKDKLPKGMSAKDVKTYFFDEETGRWLALEKVALVGDTIHSKTNHFTDMINAVIQVPDAPQSKAYQSTQIKDLKVANPGAKINLIQPPKASSRGDASLSYPIEIPAGRLGVAPQLSVNYNSSAQNGWMGLGWNLSIPSIDIDTRWGVPRYDSALESETYTIAGQQLSPVAHRSALIPRTDEKRFYPRVEGSFSKIIRHGNSPKDYFWEVTSKNGSKSFYGGITTVDDNAVLKDAKGNIAHWGLVKSIDLYGNSIFYNYTKVAHRGVSDPQAMQGYQLYISNINYTGYNSDQGVYDVSFTRKNRSDISIDARLGFKKVTADLLEKIEVKYQGTAFRSYKFKYKTGAFEKSLLDTIEQLDADNKVFNTHTMSYFDEIRDASGKYVAFKNESKWLSGVAIPTTPSPSTTPTLITPTPTTPSTTIITDVNNDTLADKLIIDIRGLSVALAKVNEHSRVYFDIEKILSHGKSSLHKKDKIVDSSLLHIDNTDGLSDINYKGISYRVSEDNDGLLSLVEDKTTTKSLDNVRVWRVPFDGTIAINANVALLENSSDLRKSYSKADGVRVSIQHNETSLWAEQIKADDYTTKSPNGVDNIDVKEGDMILFRVQSGKDGAYDSVSWSPKIEYLYKPQKVYDANHLNLYKYSSQKGYLAQSNMLNIPSTGILKIEGNITKPQTSDDVSLVLVKHTFTGDTEEIWQKTYLANEQVSTETNISSIALSAGDKIALNISSTSNIDFKSINWNPKLSYDTSKDLFINKVLRQDSKFSGTLIPKYRIYETQSSSSNEYSWAVPYDGLLEAKANIPDIFENIDVTFTIKSYNKLLAKQTVTIKNGISDKIKSFKIDVKKGEKLFFEYHLNRDIVDIYPPQK